MKKNPPELNRLDVSRYKISDPVTTWLTSNGYWFKLIGNKVFAVRGK